MNWKHVLGVAALLILAVLILVVLSSGLEQREFNYFSR